MRLIDAEALIEDVIAHSYPLTNAFSVGGIDDGMFTLGIQQVVDVQPTIDAVPVVHGEWKKGIHIAKCSVCGEDVWFPEDYLEDMDMLDDLHMNYCPNCGAKMDGKENEE